MITLILRWKFTDHCERREAGAGGRAGAMYDFRATVTRLRVSYGNNNMCLSTVYPANLQLPAKMIRGPDDRKFSTSSETLCARRL